MPLLLAVFVLPPVLLISAIIVSRDKRSLRQLIVLGLALESCNGYLAYKDMHYWDGIDENPKVVSSDIVGTWHLDEESVTFVDDGSFATSKGVRGSWSADRGSLHIADPSETVWWVMKESGQLFLLPEPSQSDPDEWNLDARFVKSAVPSVR